MALVKRERIPLALGALAAAALTVAAAVASVANAAPERSSELAAQSAPAAEVSASPIAR